MDNERTAVINIGDEEYTLLLTTKATKEIAGRYGGLENLGEKLMKSENFEMAIGEIVWLITLLANQSILIHNLKDKEHPKELLTEDVVELLTTPSTSPDTKPPLRKRSIRAPSGMWKARKTQKTHKSGNGLRCGAVYPASLLRPCPPASQPG